MLFDYLSNIKTIITIRCESIVAKVLSNQNETIREPFYRHNILNETKRFIVNIILTLISSITIGFYVYNHIVAWTVILVWTVAMIYQYVQRLSGSFYNFAWLYSQLVTNKTDFQTVEHIIEAYQDTHKKEDEQALGLRNHIAIRDLHFSYSKNKEVLNTINLDIRSGQKIALVWSSGNGKSTLLGLLRGLYDANKVSVAIDGKKYDNLNPLHNISSLIPQDPEIFEHSIRYNITMGNEVDDLELQKYIDIACFEEVVKDLPHGLDSDIKEKWVNLSWGQKQRLALARGLFLGQSSDILLLDEATSSVDSLGEKHIYEALFREFNNKTIIASVHRLHMLDMFDMIYVIDKGRVVESGNLKTVLSLDGIAKHMRDNYMRNHHTK